MTTTKRERKFLVALNGCGCLSAVAHDAPDLDRERWLREHDHCRIESIGPEEFERRFKVDGSWWKGSHCERHWKEAKGS